MIDKLKEYLQHKLFCSGDECVCGLDSLLQETETEQKPAGIQWVSVKDDSPKQGGNYLVYDISRKTWGVTDWWGSFDIIENEDGTIYCKATHYAEINFPEAK